MPLRLLFGFLLCFPAFLAAAERASSTITVTVEGVERSALLFRPVGDAAKPAPLVFAFHGHGGGSRQAAASFRLHEEWPEAAVVYPQGLNTPGKITDPEGKKAGWQTDPEHMGGRDLKFFDALLAKLKTDLKVDEKRIYSMGHSNGAGFTYLLWSQRGETFAALGPSAGFWAGIKVSPPKPKPLIHFAGRNDPLVKFAWQSLAIEGVKKINGSAGSEGQPWEGKATLYAAKEGVPTVTFIHDGGHEYHRETTGLIVKFFKSKSL